MMFQLQLREKTNDMRRLTLKIVSRTQIYFTEKPFIELRKNQTSWQHKCTHHLSLSITYRMIHNFFSSTYRARMRDRKREEEIFHLLVYTLNEHIGWSRPGQKSASSGGPTWMQGPEDLGPLGILSQVISRELD